MEFAIHIHHHVHVDGCITLAPGPGEDSLSIEIGPFTERASTAMPPTDTTTIVMKDQQEFKLRFKQAKDRTGNAKPFAGPLTVVASDPSAFVITQVDPVNDPALFNIKATPAPGHLGVFTIDASDSVLTKRYAVTVDVGDEDSLDIEVSDPTDVAPDTSTPGTPPTTGGQDTNPVTVGDTETTPTGGE